MSSETQAQSVALIDEPHALFGMSPPQPLLYAYIPPQDDYNIIAVKYTLGGDDYGAWVKLPFNTKRETSGHIKDALIAHVKTQIAVFAPTAVWGKDVTDVRFAYNFDNVSSEWESTGGPVSQGGTRSWLYLLKLDTRNPS